jgi:hypothetical protein
VLLSVDPSRKSDFASNHTRPQLNDDVMHFNRMVNEFLKKILATFTAPIASQTEASSMIAECELEIFFFFTHEFFYCFVSFV